MVRELSKHQSAFLFDCCVFIARFASLSCYSSAKTRIRLVKSYQINESFCSITRCALLRIVYRFIVVSTCFRCLELQVCPLSSPRYRFGESVMKMPKGPLMSPPKHPLEQMIQLYQGTTQPMIGCSGTKGSRTIS